MRSSRRNIALVAFVLATVGMTVGLSASRPTAAHHIRENLQSVVTIKATKPVQVADPVDLPVGYARPIALTADPTRPGVWFLGANANGDGIFFWDPVSSSLQQYLFSRNLQFGIQAGLTVDSSGTVWAGVDETLIRLDPSTGDMTYVDLPPVPADPDAPASPSGAPPSPESFHAVSAVVVETNGTIAIATAFSPSILVYSPQTGSFVTVQLPSADIPSGLTPLPEGGVAVATPSHNLDLVSSSGTVNTSELDSYTVACTTQYCVTTPTPNSLERVPTADEPNGPIVTSSGASNIGLGPLLISLTVAPTFLNNDTVIVATSTGFAAVNLSTEKVDEYLLPAPQCSTNAMSGPGSGGLPATTSCQEVPVDYVLDSAGNVWFTANFGAPEILEVSSGSISGGSTASG